MRPLAPLLAVPPTLLISLLVACAEDAGSREEPDVAHGGDVASDVGGSEETSREEVAAETSEPDVVAPPEPWQHVGPIDHGTAPAPARPLFIERSEALPSGVTVPEARAMIVDFDGDGREDVVALGTTANMSPVFLRNVTEPGGAWGFEDWTAKSGMQGVQMVLLVFGDLDNDGDADAFSGTSFRSGSDGKLGVWLNDGAGTFTYAGANGLDGRRASGLFKEMSAATLADFDHDGVLDLYIAMFNLADLAGNMSLSSPNELYKGDGAGSFAQFPLPDQHNPLTSQVHPSLAGAPRRSYGVCPADYDDDGDLDLFVNNYGAGRPAADDPPKYWEWNFLWRNDGAMGFVDVAVASQVHATLRGIGGVQEERPVVMDGVTYPSPIGGNGFGCSWGDFDNDGDLDLVVGQIAHPDYKQTDRLMLHVNPGGAPGSERVFGEESAERGLEYYEDELHPVFVDIDLDGRLDLAVSRLRGGSKWEAYLQSVDQHFDKEPWEGSGVDITQPGPSLWLDVDGDGDLDFFMPKATTGKLFENVAAGGNRLVIELVGKAPRDATGARVTLETSIGKHVRELVGGTGHYNTQQTRRLHFGLGGDSGAAAVTVRWPDGEVQVLGDVKANLQLRVEQGGEVAIVGELTP